MIEICLNGKWSAWSGWSGCAPGVCAGNQKIRTRTCSNPVPSTDGAYCVGDNAEQKDCMIDGGWTEWSQWSQCENPCGGSYVNRTRECDNPKPTPDGKPCTGKNVETKLECIWPCPTEPVDGQWSEWSKWSSCPQSCGIPSGTFITRTRQCNRPPAMNGGKPCQGDATEAVKSCFTPCPVDGGFTLWSSWSRCSRTCGNGMQRRSRSCTSPLPRHGGRNCTSDYSQMKSCKLQVCPGAVDGGWSAWTSWSQCSEGKFCLRGNSSRSRSCNNPPPKNGGDDCGGVGVEKRNCPTPKEGCTGWNVIQTRSLLPKLPLLQESQRL
ncbi:coadhesin-like [Actinia tenebrosa]|uniref:Coadhesin-like n=1 Tax=Actinia tenebrosa TaxID=6105 RepID=A0A6P8I636_ACTTE|nr:coadhesin-like [Actinia tenebrosa]